MSEHEPAYVAELTPGDMALLRRGETVTFRFPEAVIEDGIRFDVEVDTES